ncbi:hypothetical protein KAU19_04180, partial [Candidatus Parcubacteria bacterium]|nr:hypothetical protein [Candidatus Parcubacteria bacterium]
KKEKFKDLVIFTTTFYKEDRTSEVRSALAEELFKNARKLGIKCAVIDGGSNIQFIKKAEQFENVKFIIEPHLGMGEGRRRALTEAINMASTNIKESNFLWVEPEKCGLITEANLTAMINHLRKGEADIVVPARKSKDTLPKFQAWIETRANKRAGKTLLLAEDEKDIREEEIDLWFGPKMFNLAGAQYFLDYKGKLDKWDAIIKPVIDAHQDGKKITSVPVDFKYEESQKKYEEASREFKKKRLEQYATIFAELGDDFWKDKLNNKKRYE